MKACPLRILGQIFFLDLLVARVSLVKDRKEIGFTSTVFVVAGTRAYINVSDWMLDEDNDGVP